MRAVSRTASLLMNRRHLRGERPLRRGPDDRRAHMQVQQLRRGFGHGKLGDIRMLDPLAHHLPATTSVNAGFTAAGETVTVRA